VVNEFNCNKSTIIRAYDELQKEHLIYSVPKSGLYVIEKGSMSSYGNNSTADFSSTSPAVHLLPYQECQHCIEQALVLYKDSLFHSSDTQGLTGLTNNVGSSYASFLHHTLMVCGSKIC
jgi:DNA-binding transcriptional MocR family regulator